MSMSTLNSCCRFCAEEKPDADMTDLSTQKTRRSIIKKLYLIGVIFVDFSNKMLPEKACFECCKLINVSYKFFLKVKRSQKFLSKRLKNQSQNHNGYGIDASTAKVKEENDENELDYTSEGCTLAYCAAWPQVALASDGDNKPDSQRVTPVKDEDHPVETDETERVGWDAYPWQCSVCDCQCGSLATLRAHAASAHGVCLAAKCADCTDGGDGRFIEFVAHVRKHRKELRNYCEFCNIKTEERAEARAHAREHARRAAPCSHCGQEFHTEALLHEHVSACAPPAPRAAPPAPCACAGGGGGGAPCAGCVRGFSQKRTRKPLTGTGEGSPAAGGRRRAPPDLACPVCGNIMKTTHSLRGHLLTHGERAREHTCERCGRAYYTRGALLAHRKTHDPDPQESCKICHKSFLTAARLRKHVRTHNLRTPYECDACRRRFSSKDRLREHVSVHSDLRPHRCPFCPKRFRHRSMLKIHEHQHTGARPYRCAACGMDFANWSNCNKHSKRKHGASIARHALTPRGRVALDPATGRAPPLLIDPALARWTDRVLGGAGRPA